MTQKLRPSATTNKTGTKDDDRWPATYCDTASKKDLPAASIFDRMVGPPARFAKDFISLFETQSAMPDTPTSCLYMPISISG
jgi:hypothetical protein